MSTAVDSDGGVAAQSIRSTVSVTANNAPTTVAPTVRTAEDTSVTITLKATDLDLYDRYALNFTITAGPSNGVLVVSGSRFNASGFDGTAFNVVYTPSRNYFGPDQFTYSTTDNLGAVVRAMS